jgi:hypothetical protein
MSISDGLPRYPNSWIGVDLDGTLARHERWVDELYIGDPIMPMVDRVRAWLSRGWTVKIVTARVGSNPGLRKLPLGVVRDEIADWTEEHIGTRLEVTAEKDYAMVELWDDRAVQVVPNTGMRADGQP